MGILLCGPARATSPEVYGRDSTYYRNFGWGGFFLRRKRQKNSGDFARKDMSFFRAVIGTFAETGRFAKNPVVLNF